MSIRASPHLWSLYGPVQAHGTDSVAPSCFSQCTDDAGTDVLDQSVVAGEWWEARACKAVGQPAPHSLLLWSLQEVSGTE